MYDYPPQPPIFFELLPTGAEDENSDTEAQIAGWTTVKTALTINESGMAEFDFFRF